MKKKILVIGPHPLPDNSPYGGVESVVTNLTDSLSEYIDLDINVISRNGEIKNDVYARIGNKKVFYVARRSPKILTSLLRDLNIVKKIIYKIKPDIIHTHGSESAYLALKTNYPCVLTVHGLIWGEQKFSSSIVREIFNFFMRILTERVVAKSNHIVTINPYSEKILSKYFNSNFFRIVNPVDERFFKIKNSNNKNLILFVGHISEPKGLMDLLKAIKILNDNTIKIEVAGSIRDKQYYSKVINYIENNGLDSQVSFLGKLDRDMLCKKYSEMSVLCLTSKQETAPMVVSEAMASQKPVISYNICGMPYMIDDGQTGFTVDLDDVNSLAEKIKLLIGNKRLRLEMGSNGRNKAQREWSSSLVAKKTREMYFKIIEGNLSDVS